MPAYLCRWPNGDVSLLNARNKSDAIVLLDEFDDAESAELYRLNSLLVDLRLNDEGQLELNAVGETTEAEILKLAFPELAAKLGSDELINLDNESDEYRVKVRHAVENERQRGSRQGRKRTRQPSTEVGKRLKQQTGAATVVVDRWVESVGEAILEATDEETVQ